MNGFNQVNEQTFIDFINHHSEKLKRWNQTIADRIDFKNGKGELIACKQLIDNSFWIKSS